MGSKNEDAKSLMKRIMKQIGGDIDAESELIPEYCVVGKGIMFCYDPSNRTFVKITRGSTVYVIYENYDTQGRLSLIHI